MASRTYCSRPKASMSHPIRQPKLSASGDDDGIDRDERDRSPNKGQGSQGRIHSRDAYTMIEPKEDKRQQTKRVAEKERRAHEAYQAQNRPHFNFVGTVGGDSVAGPRQMPSTSVAKPRSVAKPPKIDYRAEEKRREQALIDKKKSEQRLKAENNEKQEKERQARLDRDRKLKQEAFLNRLENKRPTPAASASIETSHNERYEEMQSSGSSESLALDHLRLLFPNIEPSVLSDLLAEANNNVQSVIDMLSQ